MATGKHRRRRVLAVGLVGTGLTGAVALGLATFGTVVATAPPSAAATGTVSITIPGQFLPQAVAVDPVTDMAYVAGIAEAPKHNAGSVAVINLATGALVTQISGGLWDSAVAVDAATDTIYVSSSNTESVLVIDGATNTVTATLSVKPGEAPNTWAALAQDPATGEVYLAANTETSSNTLAGDIETIDEATNSITPLPSQPCPNGVNSVAVNPATGTLYASCDGGDGLAFVNAATGAVEHRISGAGGYLAVDPARDVLYVVGNGTVAYNASTGAILRTVSTGLSSPTSIAVDASTGTAFEAYFHGIALVNGTGSAGTGTIPEADLGWLGVDSVTGTIVFAGYPPVQPASSVVSLIPPPVAPRITSAASTTTVTGGSVNFYVKAAGTPASTFTESGRLPLGVMLTPDGNLTGSPEARTGGTYKITITAANGVPPTETQAFALLVHQPASFTSPNHATFRHGAKYAFTIKTTGYPTAAITRVGALPSGVHLTINKNGTATLSGIAAAHTKGTKWVLHIRATNHVGKAATQAFTLTIS
jgi:YVTN family beta-propeller protein